MNQLTGSSTRTTIGLGVSVFAVFLVLIFQGLDFTDMGFWLTGYQDFRAYPESMGCRASCWLTYFICHQFGGIFGFEVLAYKAGHALVCVGSAVISYRVLSTCLGASPTLAFLVFLSALLSRTFGGNWLGYNELTALFYLGAAAFLYAGLRRDRMVFVLLSGVLFGANFFIRLPNIVGMAFVSAVWLHAWASQWSSLKAFLWSMCFFGGLSLGALSILLLIYFNGHIEIYSDSVRELFAVGPKSDGPDSSSRMLRMFFNDHLSALLTALPLMGMGILLSGWISKRSRFLRSSFILIGSLGLFAVLYRWGYWKIIIPGVCYITLLFVVINRYRSDRESTLLAFISGMVLLLVPLGSNNGIANAVYGLWLALPFSLITLWGRSDFVWGRLSINSGGWSVFFLILISAFSLNALVGSWSHTYLDHSNRIAMISPVNCSGLSGVYTTARRAAITEELIEAMSRFTNPGDKVLAYNAIPLVHFLTKTHPYIGEPWPDIVNSDRISKLIAKKELEDPILPYVVRAKGSTYDALWPVDPQPVAIWWRQDEPRQIFAEFEKRHEYQVAWENDFFQILEPRRYDKSIWEHLPPSI